MNCSFLSLDMNCWNAHFSLQTIEQELEYRQKWATYVTQQPSTLSFVHQQPETKIMTENILWLEFGIFYILQPADWWLVVQWCSIEQDESDQNWLNFPSAGCLWLIESGLAGLAWLTGDWLNNKKHWSLPRVLTPWSPSSWLSMTLHDTMPVVILRSLESDCFIIPLHLACNYVTPPWISFNFITAPRHEQAHH